MYLHRVRGVYSLESETSPPPPAAGADERVVALFSTTQLGLDPGFHFAARLYSLRVGSSFGKPRPLPPPRGC